MGSPVRTVIMSLTCLIQDFEVHTVIKFLTMSNLQGNPGATY